MKNLRLFSAPRAWPVRLVTTALFGLLLSGYLGVPYAAAQVPAALAPVPRLQFFDASGRALPFGCVFSYQTLSSTPLATYSDYTGTIQNTNPVVLTAGGFVGTGGLWLQAGVAYRLVVKSAGGSNCASGSTISTVDGIGGGTTTLTTIVPYSPTPSFTDAAQNQLFQITLTGNATAQPITATGVTPPGLITFEITQDGAGGHTFSWPSNTVGGVTISSGASALTQQTFLWNGASAVAVGSASYEFNDTSTAFGVTNFYDFGLTSGAAVCTDANKQLVSGSCGSIYSVTYNGQTVSAGNSGNVNNGAAAFSIALNEGNGSPIAGLSLAAHQVAVGQTSSNPVPKTVPDCQDTVGKHLNYTQSGDTWSCGTSIPAAAGGDYVQATTLSGCGATCTFNFAHTFSVIHSCVCSGEGGSCNVASKSTSSCTINTTVGTNDVTVSGVF
jgi:hypothetical protein